MNKEQVIKWLYEADEDTLKDIAVQFVGALARHHTLIKDYEKLSKEAAATRQALWKDTIVAHPRTPTTDPQWEDRNMRHNVVEVSLNDIKDWNIGGGLPLGLILVRGTKAGLKLFGEHILGSTEITWDAMYDRDMEPCNIYQDTEYSCHLVVAGDIEGPMPTTSMIHKATLSLELDEKDSTTMEIRVLKQRDGAAPTLMQLPLYKSLGE